MKYGVGICLVIVVLWGILALLQLWNAMLEWAVFMKITLSAVVVIGVVLLVTLGVREYLSEKDLKSKGFLD